MLNQKSSSNAIGTDEHAFGFLGRRRLGHQSAATATATPNNCQLPPSWQLRVADGGRRTPPRIHNPLSHNRFSECQAMARNLD